MRTMEVIGELSTAAADDDDDAAEAEIEETEAVPCASAV